MTMPLQVFDSDKLQELSSSQLMLKEQEQTLCADGQFIYICQICRKQFQSWEVLLEHIDRHFGLSSKFKCETGTRFLVVSRLLISDLFST
jgi:hypothetical protein